MSETNTIPADLIAAYRKTNFIVRTTPDEADINFRIGEENAALRSLLALQSVSTAAFLTACAKSFDDGHYAPKSPKLRAIAEV